MLLTLVVAGLAGGLIWLVPQLEEASGGVDGEIELAAAPGLRAPQGGLVEFELTEDLEYIVADGETLSEIARRFDLSYGELADYNGIEDANTIVAGEVIVVPGTFSRRLAQDSDE
ncbi:MAG: LysM peptidoglycan-binding domain-containing protein [Spirochaetota bacterium]